MGIETTSTARGVFAVHSRRRRQPDELYRQAFGPILAPGTIRKSAEQVPIPAIRKVDPSGVSRAYQESDAQGQLIENVHQIPKDLTCFPKHDEWGALCWEEE